jgi:hypothetical protein
MIIALAGRRVDAPNTSVPRFPAANLAAVKARIAEFMQGHGVTGLVCAAACGADILALEAAAELGLRRRVVLPFDRFQFRAMSVTDRGGDWGERYDQLITEAIAADDLHESNLDPNDGQTWFAGNLDILRAAERLATQTSSDLYALVIWDGASRGGDDATGHFKMEAEARGLGVAEIITL